MILICFITTELSKFLIWSSFNAPNKHIPFHFNEDVRLYIMRCFFLLALKVQQ